jgi:hypothetical protein
MGYNYYRAQQELAKLIAKYLKSNLSNEEAAEINYTELMPLMIVMESKFMRNLYEVGREFGVWLDDTDIRAYDQQYNTLLTGRLEKWVLENLWLAEGEKRDAYL